MNKLRFLTPKLHGILDYAAAAGLIFFPFLLGLSGLSLWLSVVGGAGLALYSLLTDYAFSITDVISFKAHLALDISAAAAFFVAPFLFGWSGLVMGYYFVMAAGVVVVVTLSDPNSQAADTV